MNMILEITLRLFVALLLGGVIGIEREYRSKEAGFRTHFLVALGSPYILNYDYDFASEKERDFEPPPLEYQILLTYSITDTVTKDMESCFSTDCQETYNQTPVSFTFITPETEELFKPDNYPERFSRWFEKFAEHVTYNL